jgi:hypothetical protein
VNGTRNLISFPLCSQLHRLVVNKVLIVLRPVDGQLGITW